MPAPSSDDPRPGVDFLAPPDDVHRAPLDGSFRLGDVSTRPPDDAPDDKKCEHELEHTIERLEDCQRLLYAQDRHALLCVFQAMDAAGKDSTIRAVFSGLNPAGFQVFSFKKPSSQELDHDFLWRTARALPERGRIGIFNRSYYEEVLVVRVHPEFLASQRLPEPCDRAAIWEQRFASIRDHEKHLARNGTVVLKFFLNVSADEQRRRFLDRLKESHKNWKFSEADVEERRYWPAYMEAFEEAIAATSRPWAPWYAIPADSKPYMRMAVARILEKTFASMRLEWPELDAATKARLDEIRERLRREER